MSLLRTNFLANAGGKAWMALLSFAFIPVYIAFLGIEAYGLIGIYLTIYAVMGLLDLGLGTTLNRELARLSAQSGAAREMRDLLRTLEIAFWVLGAVLGLSLALLGPQLAPLWIKPGELSGETLGAAVRLMGVAIACQWPLTLYTGGLMGLQRQVLSNAISAAAATVRTLGAVLVLWQVSATIEAFFAWQIAVSLAETLLTAVATWHALPAGPPAVFRTALAVKLWRFAAGVSGVSILSVVLTQLDKILLSGVLPLAGFGTYMVASRVASGLYYLVGPVIATFFPRFSQLLESGGEAELRRVYHQCCQLMSLLIFPPALVLVLFAHEVLWLWTQDTGLAASAGGILALLTAGTALNALASPPHILQLASGWTRLALVSSALVAVLLVPLIYFMTLRYGGVGAAAVWLLLNIVNVLVNAVFTHRRLLVGELWPWLRGDVAPALLASLAVAGAWRWLPFPDTLSLGILSLAAVSCATLAAAAAATPELRRFAHRHFQN